MRNARSMSTYLLVVTFLIQLWKISQLVTKKAAGLILELEMLSCA